MKQNKKTKQTSIVKRIFQIFLIGCLIGIFLVIVIDRYVCITMDKYLLSAEEAAELSDVDCILVLGAGVYGDQPSPMLLDRIETGVVLYKTGASAKLLMSGDHGRTDYNEVAVMKRIAIDEGVLSSDVFMDHAGFSTYESAVRAAKVFQAKKVLIVTQKYHIYRALYDARANGIEAYGVATERSYTGWGQIKRDVREVAARVKDFFYCLIGAEVSYEGDAIPVSGNGDCTND